MIPEGRFESEMRALQAPAWRLACWLLGDEARAEDAVQEAMLRAWRSRAELSGEGALRPWFLRIVANTARNLAREDARRRAREEAMPDNAAAAAGPAESAAREEAVAALRRAMGRLDERLRAPVLLHHVEGLSHQEIGQVLDMPEGTSRKYVSRGLERLREALVAAGLASAAPLLPELIRAGWTLPAPASLAGRLAAAMAETRSGAASGAGVAAKGGLFMKIGLGAAALGLAAGSVIWAAGGTSAEPANGSAPASAPTQAVKKFDVPVWSPDARWEVLKLGGVDSGAHLDGPVREMEMYSLGALGPGYRNAQGGSCYIGWWDRESNRAHEVAGSGRGLLDGPFSRARFAGWHYTWDADPVFDADQRNLYIADPFKGAVHIRAIDFEKQEVRTVVPGVKGFLSVCAIPDGKLLLVTKSGLTKYNAADGAKEGETALAEVDKVRGYTRGFAPAAFDEVHGRLYVGLGHPDWYNWYWDVKDGSFHGVLPKPKDKSKARPNGSFDNISWYAESGTLSFGPDDPDKRFLYATNNDTWQFFRMDLEKRQVAAIITEGNGRDGKPVLARFSETDPPGRVPVYLYHKWRPDGSVTFYTHSPVTAPMLKRVK